MVMEINVGDTIFCNRFKEPHPLYVHTIRGEVMHCSDSTNLEYAVLKCDITKIIHKKGRS